MNKYKVEIIVKHVVRLFAENEAEAKEDAESRVFEEKIDTDNEDTIIGYKVIPLRADSLMD